MTDRIGAVYATVGGLVVGVLAGYLPSAGGFALAALVGALVLAIYFVLAPLVDWPLPGRTSGIADTVAEARELSQAISQFAGTQRRTRPLDTPRSDTWGRDTERMLLVGAGFMADYMTQFSVRTLVSYDKLVALGASTDRGFDRFSVEHPTNPLGVEQVARVLGVMAAEVEAKHLR